MRQSAEGIVPCPECGGCGVAHCCDGLVACGEIDGDVRFERAKTLTSFTDRKHSITDMREQNEADGFKP
jgi:hypothetical protein